MTGQRVGPYELGRRLGGGRLGPVHEAWHVESGSQVALRLLERPPGRGLAQRIAQEAPRLVALDHPHVLGYGAIELQSRPGWLTTAFLEATSLTRMLTRAITPELSLRWARETAMGLAALHDENILHRDVKPSNVLIDPAGHAVLIDVGLAPDFAGSASQVETTDVSLEYVTPEHFMGQPLTPACDVYQWGLLAYRLVYGHLPNPDMSPQSAALARFDSNVVLAPPPVPFLTRLVDVIAITLEFDAVSRPATGRQILELLDSDRPIPRPSARPEQAPGMTAGPLLSRGIAVERLSPGVEDYEIERSIGKGAMGEVFEGVRVADGRRVAIKVLKPALLAEEALRQRFEREVELMMSLDSPHLVKLLDYKLVEPWVYLVMELLEGEDLARRLEKRGALPALEALAILEPVLEGLAALHEKGVVHRDLKPGNIFLTAKGPRILDLGLARAGTKAGLTAHGQFLGTPLYASPEMRLAEEITPASDVFTLGTLFYEMLTARKDFRNLDSSETLEVALKADPALSDERSRPVVLALVDLFCRMTALRPADRFPDGAAVLAQIRPLRQKLESRASRKPAPTRGREKPSVTSVKPAPPPARPLAGLPTGKVSLAILAIFLALAAALAVWLF